MTLLYYYIIFKLIIPSLQTPQFNINISLNTGQQAQQQPSPSSQLAQSQGPITDNRRPMAGGYFKFPVPFRHQRYDNLVKYFNCLNSLLCNIWQQFDS